MSVLDNYITINLETHLSKDESQWVKDIINRAIWSWYNTHKNDVIFVKKILFIKLNIKVSDLEGVFELIFGKPK